MPEIKRALRTALLLAAYISSEKPDITENEVQKTFYRPSGKLKTSAVRKWDIGVRYATEVRRRLTETSDTNRPHGTGKSPRPHIRKAHWHIYRIGPGRKETKVLWLAPIEVNCRIGNEKAENTRCRPGPEIGKGTGSAVNRPILPIRLYAQPNTNDTNDYLKQSFGSAFLFVPNLCHNIAILIASQKIRN